jgi:hypothetical protein
MIHLVTDSFAGNQQFNPAVLLPSAGVMVRGHRHRLAKAFGRYRTVRDSFLDELMSSSRRLKVRFIEDYTSLVMTRGSDLFDTSTRILFRSVITDLEVGLTFTRIAFSKPDGSEDRSRNQTKARKAYDTLWTLSRKPYFTRKERQENSEGLDRLKFALRELGEAIP